MQKIVLKSKSGYGIPCIFEFNGNEKKAVIISHGFGSSKESPTAVTMAERLKSEGIASVRFDFPSHGESDACEDDFIIENCINDLAEVEKYIAHKLPSVEIYYFSSSFGAFINLLYLNTGKAVGKKSFLRCAAVDMPGIMESWMYSEYASQLRENGYVILDEDYFRPIKVTNRFMNDLKSIDLLSQFRNDGNVKLRMIHGMEDETAPFSDAEKFSDKFGIELIRVEGADHRFTPEGAMDMVRDEAIKFYCQSDSEE